MKRLLIVVLFAFVIHSEGQDVGERCSKGGVNGICKVIGDCPAAINDYKMGKRPQICSFQGMDPVVCCGSGQVNQPQSPPVTTQKPPVATTTKQRVTSTTEYEPPTYDYVSNSKYKDGCEPIPTNYTSPKTGQKAWDKCLEYQEKWVYPCRESNALSGGKARRYDCKHEADQLVVGGVNAAQWEFPHMVLLGFGSNVQEILWQCGGSLISERFILTAGHCTYARDIGPVTYALLGILSRKEHVEGSQRYKIKQIIKHPEYHPPAKYNDIALLETETEMVLSEFVLPACLHVDTSAPDEQVLATGWGATQNRGASADVLQKVILNKFSEFECTLLFPPTRYTKRGFDATTQMCYGDKDMSKDTCQGDSGGPLQIKSKKIHCMYVITAVTSYGRACGVVGDPGIYTRVAPYVSWIEKIVWP